MGPMRAVTPGAYRNLEARPEQYLLLAAGVIGLSALGTRILSLHRIVGGS